MTERQPVEVLAARYVQITKLKPTESTMVLSTEAFEIKNELWSRVGIARTRVLLQEASQSWELLNPAGPTSRQPLGANVEYQSFDAASVLGKPKAKK